MTTEEFLIEKFNSCICVQKEDEPVNIYMIYDDQYIRQCKINSLIGLPQPEYIYNDNSIILFEQDYKSMYFFYDLENIFSVLLNNYGLNYPEIFDLIKNFINNDDKLKKLTPMKYNFYIYQTIIKNKKLKVLTSVYKI